jgi:flagella basal body P-ring formation protein FlgA
LVINVDRALCVERRTLPVSEGDLKRALVGALQAAGAMQIQLEVLDYSKIVAPPGSFEFDARSISQNEAGPARAVLNWRGRFRYDAVRTMPVWAKVSLMERRKRMVAARDLPAGTLLTAVDFREIETLQPWDGTSPASRLADISGMVNRRPIKSGTELKRQDIVRPADIERGDEVRVMVATAGARLTFSAKARTSARRGEHVLLTNPTSKLRFSAVASGRGEALLSMEAANENDSRESRRPVRSDSRNIGSSQIQASAGTDGVGQDHR